MTRTYIILLIFAFNISLLYSQNPEDLIPKDAITVFSINKFDKIQNISLEKLMSYEFMSELEQEQYDGSTNGKTLKNSGLDLSKKMSVFSGRNDRYLVTGVTFGLKNTDELFKVFDDFQKVKSPYKGYELYSSYFNKLFIKNNTALLIRLEVNEGMVNKIADSIDYEIRGVHRWDPVEATKIEEWDDESIELTEVDPTDPSVLVFETEDTVIYDVEPSKELMEEITSLSEVNHEKTYWEIRDSVQLALHEKFEKTVLDELIKNNISLITTDEDFKKQISHDTKGTFYFDNSRNITSAWSSLNLPGTRTLGRIMKNMENLYSNNKTLGDLVMIDGHLKFKITNSYSEDMGSIYSALNDTKMQKKLGDYIHQNCPAFFIYKINLQAAYEKASEILLPILRKENSSKVTASVMMYDILNEFIDKDALFNSFQGSVFATFNGTKKVLSKNIEYIYDEETFEYTEVPVEVEKDMPLFTMGISSSSQEIVNKIFTSISKVEPMLKQTQSKNGNYWEIKDGIMNGASVFFFHENEIFFITNDEKIAKYNQEGYGGESISKKELKKAKKGGAMYMKVDFIKAIDQIPLGLFKDEAMDFITSIKKGSGMVEISTAKTSKNKSLMTLSYDFDDTLDTEGKHILDLINAVYLFSK
tara:strand:+ start:324 stop:2255 length:1932 start_codon:yes stop_codon:yes gene_type:complete